MELAMEQGEARKRAKELGGIAVGARLSPSTGCWIIGGWSGQAEEWIVVTLDKTAVLDDGQEGYGPKFTWEPGELTPEDEHGPKSWTPEERGEYGMMWNADE
jgi:hypothetical protein